MSATSRPSCRVRGCRLAATVRTGVALLWALLLLSPVRIAHAQDEAVTWAVYDAPPFMMAAGPDGDLGVFDRIRHFLDQRLSGAPARTLRAPFPRILASLKDGAALCFIGGVETPERDGFAVFSVPIAMFYPMRVVVHAPEGGRLEARAPLSLATLLADRTLRTSVLKDRSLGSDVDALMRQAAPLHVHSEFGEAFRMLFADRLDYLVEYSAIAAYGASRLGQDGAFLTLPFTEAPGPVFSRVMCPKNEWGRRLVARVDAILRAERGSAAYRRIVEAWVSQDDLPTIRDVYDRSFLQSE